jgi:hypothetical protein
MRHAWQSFALLLLVGCPGGGGGGGVVTPPTPVVDTGSSCEPIESESGLIYICHSRPGPSVAQQAPCASLQLVPHATRPGPGCVANCGAACDLTAAQAAAGDQQVDQLCDQQCRANGQCPAGRTCVMNTVVNRTTDKTCIQPSSFCTTAPNVANCAALGRAGECTCKCV